MKKNIRITEKALSHLIDNVINEKKIVKEFKVKDFNKVIKELIDSINSIIFNLNDLFTLLSFISKKYIYIHFEDEKKY